MFWLITIIMVVFIGILWLAKSDEKDKEKWIEDCTNNIIAFGKSFENEFNLPIYTEGVTQRESYMKTKDCYYVELSGYNQRANYQLVVNAYKAKAVAIFNDFSHDKLINKRIYQYDNGKWKLVADYDRREVESKIIWCMAQKMGFNQAHEYYKDENMLEHDLRVGEIQYFVGLFGVTDPDYNYY